MRYYTEEEIKNVYKMWDTHTIAEIAKKLKRHPRSIEELGKRMKKLGYPLSDRRSRPDKRIKSALEPLMAKKN